MTHTILENDWQPLLKEEFSKPYYQNLREFLKEEYAEKTIFPEMNSIYQALHNTPFSKVKVVILGQDPYHGKGQAQGLSFSVQPGVKIPPSLRNIFKELSEDTGASIPQSGNLEKWSRQGVLLLNTVLTVQEGKANSHQNKGWETLTNEIIRLLGEREQPTVFILWGKPAASKRSLINEDNHCVIVSPHPSPFAARKGFFGSRPFTRANSFLKENGIEEVDWTLE
ncbi:uracil-DNA glycosylase [Jeotgalibacillus proteolyticus]|uniref:Uracil-DNA glycosylase n=1 Tax=Jeotgalibacillus proteolyticus TaxID=2082395 RepID=A0A2S5G9V5_9BACL|nr:uracil-DNA glycosylase [Jeotgalibacillus proteolyticus]PPA69704.1 uracil-DNA glycosylase [Jeotgalibacillus proteolyticus]